MNQVVEKTSKYSKKKTKALRPYWKISKVKEGRQFQDDSNKEPNKEKSERKACFTSEDFGVPPKAPKSQKTTFKGAKDASTISAKVLSKQKKSKALKVHILCQYFLLFHIHSTLLLLC